MLWREGAPEVAFHTGGSAWPARNAAQWRTPCEAAGGSGRAIAHPIVNGWSSSVMRSKREGVWCILFAVTVDLAGGGWLGSVAVRGWDGGWFAEAAWVATELSRLILDIRDWLEALLGRWFLSELEGSEAGVELGRWESLERYHWSAEGGSRASRWWRWRPGSCPRRPRPGRGWRSMNAGRVWETEPVWRQQRRHETVPRGRSGSEWGPARGYLREGQRGEPWAEGL
jgi:hypothetical protein